MRAAMPSPVGRHESAVPCLPPTDPTGFIYPSYRAAQTETQRDKPSSKSSHQEVAYVSSAVGGSVSTLSFEDTTTKNRLRPCKRLGGGTRDKVRGFSRTSRRNLLRRLASINRSAFKAFKGRLISITLTYPHEYPEDPELCKNHLKALRRRLQRKFGEFAGFWRMGIQERGDELRRALHGQARGVSPRVADRQDLGGMERGTPPRPLGDGRGQPQGRLQDQADIQEACEEDEYRFPTPYNSVREA